MSLTGFILIGFNTIFWSFGSGLLFEPPCSLNSIIKHCQCGLPVKLMDVWISFFTETATHLRNDIFVYMFMLKMVNHGQ